MGTNYDPDYLGRAHVNYRVPDLRRRGGWLLVRSASWDGFSLCWLYYSQRGANMGRISFDAKTMNRRGFLGAFLGSLSAVALPRWLKWFFAPANNTVAWRMYSKPVVLNAGWLCCVHPDCERDLRDLRAREKWKIAYQQARTERYSGTPREIIARYKSHSLNGEIGYTGGFRIIETGRIPFYSEIN